MIWFLLKISLLSDIVDIKPANMEELTEVITAAEFHPLHCNVLVYSSSKGTVRLCDMRDNALCDRYAKCKLQTNWDFRSNKIFLTTYSVEFGLDLFQLQIKIVVNHLRQFR